jgi:hypothetical protein
MRNLARGQPPTEPIRVLPGGAMSTEAALRASPRQHATLAAESAGGLKPPWSNSAPTWRALGGARRSEGRRSTRRFRIRVWDRVGVPGRAGQPPHSRGVFVYFSSLIYPATSKRGAPRTRRFRCVVFPTPKIPKRRGGRKTRSRRREGGTRRAGPHRGPCGGLSAAPPVGFFHSPPSYTLRHQNAGQHAPAASSAYFRNPDKLA